MKLLAFLPILLFPSAVGAKQNDRLYNYIERYSCWNLQKERTIPKEIKYYRSVSSRGIGILAPRLG